MNEENALESEKKADRDEEGHFLEGHSIKSPGRPKGRFSITTQIIKFLEDNPTKNEEIIKWLLENKKDLIWQMIDPKPPQDFNLSGEVNLPIIYEVVRKPPQEN